MGKEAKRTKHCYFASIHSIELLLVFQLLLMAPSHQNKCLDKNPLMPFLEKNSVGIFDHPHDAVSDVCKAEWSTYKTCCDSKSLMKYVESDMKGIDDSINAVSAKVVSLLKVVSLHKNSVSKSIYQKIGLYSVLKFRVDLFNFAKQLESYKVESDKIEVRRHQCFETIKKVRADSLCYSCSGRSPHFFLQGRALISTKTCRTIVSVCADVWLDSLKLFKVMLLGNNVRTYLKNHNQDVQILDFDDDHTKRLHEYIGSHNLEQHVSVCSENMQKCSNDDTKILCETFLSLGRKAIGLEAAEVAAQYSADNQKKVNWSIRNLWQVGSSRMLVARDLKETVPITVTDGDSMHAPMSLNTVATDLTSLLGK